MSPDPSEVPGIDRAAFDEALVMRLGEAVEGWKVEIEATEVRGVYEVRVEDVGGREEARELALVGETSEQRSRELAATVTLWIDAWEVGRDPEPPPADASTAKGSGPEAPGDAAVSSGDRPVATAPAVRGPAPRARGYLVVGGRLGVAASADLDLGPTLAGGAWLAKEHLQVRGQGAWSRSREGSLSLAGVRVGGGVVVGGSLPHELWCGALLAGHALHIRAEDREVRTRWAASAQVGALLQVRHRHFVAGLLAGAELGLPPVVARGVSSHIAWGRLRGIIGVEVGVRFP